MIIGVCWCDGVGSEEDERKFPLTHQSNKPSSQHFFLFHWVEIKINKNFPKMYFRALLASQLEPTFARYVFPCFDEPALKATFNITIIHHPSYVALSNMPKLGK